jgi:hypothetical protein
MGPPPLSAILSGIHDSRRAPGQQNRTGQAALYSGSLLVAETYRL